MKPKYPNIRINFSFFRYFLKMLRVLPEPQGSTELLKSTNVYLSARRVSPQSFLFLVPFFGSLFYFSAPLLISFYLLIHKSNSSNIYFRYVFLELLIFILIILKHVVLHKGCSFTVL